MKVPSVVLGVSLGLLLAGCWALEPNFPPVPPPPNPPEGVVLLQIPLPVIEGQERASVRRERDETIPGLYGREPERAARILSHHVVVGMTSQEVVWTFLSHPSRVRDVGPPGGHVLCWERGRYFVRLDADGKAVSAGRY